MAFSEDENALFQMTALVITAHAIYRVEHSKFLGPTFGAWHKQKQFKTLLAIHCKHRRKKI